MQRIVKNEWEWNDELRGWTVSELPAVGIDDDAWAVALFANNYRLTVSRAHDVKQSQFLLNKFVAEFRFCRS